MRWVADLIQRLASAADAGDGEPDQVLMTAGETDVEPPSLEHAEKLSTTRTTPLTIHRPASMSEGR